MATKIVTKNSSTAGAAPTATDLVQGELAVNVADGRLYTEDNAAAIVELGVNPAAEITANAGIALPDNQKATFGASDDLKIHHNGSNSFIQDSGTGDLIIAGTNLSLRNYATDEIFLDGTSNAAVRVFYNGAPKLATTSTGIDVTGTATMDSLTVDGTLSSPPIMRINNAGGGWSGGDEIGRLQFYTTDASGIGARETASIRAVNDSGGVTANGSLEFWTSPYNTVARKSMNIDGRTGDISFYEDTGTTAKFFWDASSTRLTLDGAETSRSNNTYLLDIDNSAQTSNTATSGPFRVKGYYGDSLVVTGAGNVGIGMTPSKLLDLQATDNLAMRFYKSTSFKAGIEVPTSSGDMITGSAVDDLAIRSQANMLFSTGGATERMRIDASGTMILQADGAANLGRIQFSKQASTYQILGGNNIGYMGYKTGGYHRWFGSVGGEDMRLDASGNLLVGKTSTGDSIVGAELQPSGALISCRDGSIAALFNRLSSNGEVVRFNRQGVDVGSIDVTTTATSYTTSSDQRLKDNIADADDAGSKIDSIQVRKYDWKADGSHQDYGMIAQELQTVAPEAVSGDADSDDMMGVDYSKLVPMLIKEIQSLRNRVAQLETGE